MKSSKSLIFSGLFFFLLSLSSFGQSYNLSIKTQNAKNSEAIEFATIYISPCDCGGVTDADGLLKLSLKEDRYQIITSNIGFRTDTTILNLDKDTEILVELSEQNINLESVTVTGTDNRSNVEQTLMGVQRLNIKQLTLLPTAVGETDVLRGLTILPGVSSAGEASNGLSVRGGSLDQNLVLFDNAPIFNPTHLFGLFSVFSPDALSSVDLFRANIPARYGGRITSVVDVKVKNPNLQDFKMTGGIGFVSSRLGVETPIIKDKLSALATVRVARNDFIFRLSNRLKNTKANFLDGTLKLNWKASEKDNIFWTGFYSEDFYQLDINSNINSINADANQYDYTTLNNTLTWLHTFDNNASLQTNIVTSQYDPKILFPQLDKDNTIVYESGINYRSADLKYTRQANEALNFSIGGQAVQNIISPGRLLPNKEQSLDAVELQDENGIELAGFAEMEWEPSSKFALSGGLRYTNFMLLGAYEEAEYASDLLNEVTGFNTYEDGATVANYDGLEPRIGLRYKASKSTSFKASYALTRQYLQNIYNSSTPLPTSRWKNSDRYIQPQVGSTYSLGIYQNVKDDQIALSLEGYFRDIDNVLEYKPGADFFLQQYIEQDIVQAEGKAYGVEFALQKPEGRWNGWLNYTWSRSLRRSNAEELSSQINNNEWYVSDFDRP
ncbi:MAG: TonB-dependent receptor, partial [Bacteroidota bacterium]